MLTYDKSLDGLLPQAVTDAHFGCIHIHAKALYTSHTHGREILLAAWQRMTDCNQRRDYPEIAFQVTKIYIDRAQHEAAVACLAICKEAWQSENKELARVFLIEAHMHNIQRDYAGLIAAIGRVKQHDPTPILEAECEYLMGEATYMHNPSEALQYYDNARRRFLRLRLDNPVLDFDVVRTSLRAASIAFEQGMKMVGWRNLRYAEQAAHDFENQHLIAAVLMRTAEAYSKEGDYALARKTYQDIEKCVNQNGLESKVAYANLNMAQLAMYESNDDTSEQLLAQVEQHLQENNEPYLRLQHQLACGWLAVYQDNDGELLDEFLIDIQQSNVRLDDVSLCHKTTILEGLIAAAQHSDEAAHIIDKLYSAAEFFSESRTLVEASHSYLILAWLHAQQGDYSEVVVLMHQLTSLIERIGHVKHLARLYTLSFTCLETFWSQEVELTIRDMLHLPTIDAVNEQGAIFPMKDEAPPDIWEAAINDLPDELFNALPDALPSDEVSFGDDSYKPNVRLDFSPTTPQDKRHLIVLYDNLLLALQAKMNTLTSSADRTRHQQLIDKLQALQAELSDQDWIEW